MLNQSRIASALGVANPTIDRYIDLLVDLQLVRRLRPWGGNWAGAWSSRPRCMCATGACWSWKP